MNKRFLLGAGVIVSFSLIGLSACGFGESGEEISLNVVVPENSDVAFEVNYADKEQVAALGALFDKFPKESYKIISDALKGDVDSQNNSKEADYFALLKPFIGHDWQVVGGVVLAEDSAKDDADEAIVVAKFDKDDEFEEFMQKMIVKSGKKFVESKNKGVKYWENADEKLYIAREDDVFFLSNGRKQLDVAIGRLAEGKGGFGVTKNYESLKKLSTKRLGYVYMSEKFVNGLMQAAGKTNSGFGASYGVFVAEEGGLRVLSNQLVVGEELLAKLKGNEGANGEFLNKIPDQDVILFTQIVGLVGELGAFADPSYENLVESVADYADLFNAPGVFVVSDKGMFYPAVSAYFDIDEGDGELAKTFLNTVDDFADNVIVEFDSLLAGSGYDGVGLLKREVASVKGVPMRKVYLDFGVIPAEILNGIRVYVPEMDFDTLKVEFYYGVNSDGMLVFALYPGLDRLEDGEMLVDNEVMKKGVGALKMEEVDSVSYFDFSPMFVILDKYLGMAKGSQFVSAEQVAKGEKIYGAVKNLLETVDFIAGGGKLNGEVLEGESYISIEAVKAPIER